MLSMNIILSHVILHIIVFIVKHFYLTHKEEARYVDSKRVLTIMPTGSLNQESGNVSMTCTQPKDGLASLSK